MVLLSLLLTALAGPVDAVRLPAEVLGTVVGPDGTVWRLVDAGAEDGLEVGCSSPSRRAAVAATAGSVVLVEREEVAAPMAGGAAFDPPGAPARWQAVTCLDGPVMRVRPAVSVPWLDREERRAGSWEELAEVLGTVPGLARTDAVGPWLATRPFGGALPIRSPLRWPGARTRPDPVDGEHDPWVPAGSPTAVVGPARVHLSARVRQGWGPVCLVVDGAPSCQEAAAVDRIAVVDGRVVWAELPGGPWSRRLSWDLWLPPGAHRLSVDVDALVRGRVGDGAWVDLPGPRPQEEVVVLPWTDHMPPGRWSAEGERSALFVPAVGPSEPGETSWIPVDHAVDVAPVWQEGEARLLLASGEGPCTVSVGGDRWRALGPRPILTLLDVRGGARPPTVDGCRAWARVVGAPPGVLNRRVGWQVREVPAGEVVRLVPEDFGAPMRVVLPPDRVTVVELPGARWTLSPLSSLPVLSGTGLRQVAVVALPVSGDLPVALRADAPIAVALAPEGEAAVEGLGEDALLPDALRRVALADHEAVREVALHAHAAQLALAGDLRGARREARLVGDEALVRGLGGAIVRELWALDAAGHAALPSDLAFLPVERATPELLAAASAGDALSVARALGDSPDALRWWREAAATQTLGARDALLAFVALAREGPEAAARPVAAPLRAWSHWVGVPGIGGTEGMRAPWSRPATADGLFPDAWPPERTQPVGDGWVVRLDGSATALTARCRRLEPGAGCVLRRVDAAGQEVQRWSVDVWGAPVTLDLLPRTDLTFVERWGGDEVRAELLAAGQPLREVRRVVGPASLAVRGPTVLRVEVAHPRYGVGLTQGAVRADCGDAETLTPVVGEETWVVLAGEGACVVHLELPRGALVRAALRAPRPAGLEPPANAELIGELAGGVREVVDPPPPPAGPLVSELTPRSVPAVVQAGARYATAGAIAENLEAEGRVGRLVVGPAASVDLHLRSWWLQASAGAWVPESGPAAGRFGLGAETWGGPGPLRGWLSADGEVRGDAARTAFRGRVMVGLSYRPRITVDLRASLAVDAAARLGDAADAGTLPAVWSDWREAHRLIGVGRLELRASPTRWLRARLRVDARTNGPGDPRPVDAVGAGLDLRTAAPGFRFDAGLGLEHRAADADRPVGWTSPELRAGLDAAWWTGPRLAVVADLRLSWLPGIDVWSGQAGLVLAWSGRRGWVDLRPGDQDARFALAWPAP